MSLLKVTVLDTYVDSASRKNTPSRVLGVMIRRRDPMCEPDLGLYKLKSC